MPFQAAKHKRGPILIRQAFDFLVQYQLHFAPGDISGRTGGRPRRGAGLTCLAPPGVSPGLQGDPISDAAEPTRDDLAPPEGSGLAGQHQKRRLESVLRVLLVLQHLPAHAQHHRPVPVHQGGEGPLVAGGMEVVQQLAIAPARHIRCGDEPADAPHDRGKLCVRHGWSFGESPILLRVTPAGAKSFNFCRPRARGSRC